MTKDELKSLIREYVEESMLEYNSGYIIDRDILALESEIGNFNKLISLTEDMVLNEGNFADKVKIVFKKIWEFIQEFIRKIRKMINKILTKIEIFIAKYQNKKDKEKSTNESYLFEEAELGKKPYYLISINDDHERIEVGDVDKSDIDVETLDDWIKLVENIINGEFNESDFHDKITVKIEYEDTSEPNSISLYLNCKHDIQFIEKQLSKMEKYYKRCETIILSEHENNDRVNKALNIVEKQLATMAHFLEQMLGCTNKILIDANLIDAKLYKDRSNSKRVTVDDVHTTAAAAKAAAKYK